MKRIRVALMVAVLTLGASAVSFAQDAQPQGRGSGRGMNVQQLMTGITLTAEQQTKVDSIVKKYDTERQAIRAEMQNGGDRQALMGKSRELMTKQSDEIKAVLTDEQKKVFDKNLEDMRARMQRPPSR
jgi:Spy/CpxP family protein refolding chaperone